MTPPLERVLSGQSELCVGAKGAFVRDGLIRQPDGTWAEKEPVEHMSKNAALKIINHPCVALRLQASLTHYAIRSF